MARNLLESVRWHRNNCHDEDCGVTTLLIGEVYARLLERDLTKEELEEFA